jgi:hypothetical protein
MLKSTEAFCEIRNYWWNKSFQWSWKKQNESLKVGILDINKHPSLVKKEI